MPGVKLFGVPIDLGKNELQNAVLQNLGSAPGSPVNGQFFYLTSGGHDVQARVNGAWVSLLPSSLLGLANTWTSTNVFNGAVTGNNTINLTGTGASSVGGTLGATAHVATGLTGATAASRYVGAVASGSPASGTFAIGDFTVDQTGGIWICTVAGSPGTWVRSANYLLGATNTWSASNTFSGGVVANSAVTGNGTINLTGTGASSVGGNFTAVLNASTGLTGATANSRYAGATTTGAPASGTFNTGDFIIAQNGKVWICTAGGSPGTWADAAGSGAVSSVTGTANQITASPTTGAVVLTLPAAIITPGTLNTTGNLSENGNRVWSVGNAPSITALAAATADLAMGSFKITSSAVPTTANDLTNKAYVDNARAGLSVKDPVRVATTANGTLASAFENGDTVDGITLATGDRILIKNQSTAAENGIYIVAASGAPTRATDADASGEIVDGTAVWVQSGTLNGDQRWVASAVGANPWVPGSSSSTWTMDFAATSVTAGAGLTATGQVLAVGAANGITVNADSIQVDTAVVVRKYATTIGNGSLTSFTINHNLGTSDVTVAVFAVASTFDEIECDVQHTDANNVTLLFSVAPTSNQYRVVVHG